MEKIMCWEICSTCCLALYTCLPPASMQIQSLLPPKCNCQHKNSLYILWTTFQNKCSKGKEKKRKNTSLHYLSIVMAVALYERLPQTLLVDFVTPPLIPCRHRQDRQRNRDPRLPPRRDPDLHPVPCHVES
jgi:hypothetical protein